MADVACVFAEGVLQLGVGVLFFAEGVGVGEGIGGYVAAGSVAADAVFGDDDVADVYLGVKGADGADEDGSAALVTPSERRVSMRTGAPMPVFM